MVDDDDLVRERLAELLNASHFDVEVAASGADAMRVLNSTRCHIVLTDWQMPDMDGLTLCRAVRSREQDHYTYVLMLTIRDTQHDMLTGLAAGADDYLVKGAPIEEILARLEVGRRIVHANNSLNQHSSSSNSDAATGAHDLGYLVEHLPRELAEIPTLWPRFGGTHLLHRRPCRRRVRSFGPRRTAADLRRALRRLHPQG